VGKTNSRKHEIDLQWFHADLNDAQREAVSHTDGPVLILAGAGSGKTRVLTYRMAYLLANGLAEPREILAMTFTNKAAGEMRERVSKLVPDLISGMWIGTFHSIFARLLRRECERIGFNHNFAIYDQDDQITLIKSVMEGLQIDNKSFPPKTAAHRIGMAKNAMSLPEHVRAQAENQIDETYALIYGAYQLRLHELNAMDFDDLLLKPIELFSQFPLIKEIYQDRFRYILVDEYQDTNRAQYVVLKMLAEKYKNICVVGDDDQSIYRWRGAEIRNILDFELDYPNCSKYRLEQNYRSTQNILSAAHSVIQNNRQRHPKKLWTEKSAGDHVVLLETHDDLDEARQIVDRISQELRCGERDFHDFAVLYRTNAQSRVLEEALRALSIPYIIVGGVRFYDRKEVKDVLAYLRVICNPADAINLRRIINYPNRGIGEVTLAKVETYSREKKLTMFQALSEIANVPGIPAKTAERVLVFYQLLKKYISLRDELSASELASAIVEEIGILRQFKEEGTIEALTRAENVRELLLAIAQFAAANGSDGHLEDYLGHISLVSDIDNWDDRANAVSLMTMHSAKGLEFSVVFMSGLEEGLFPLSRSLSDPVALEEERRLFYVGATRAKEKLYLTWARNRRRFGESAEGVQSRFLKELDLAFVQIEGRRISRGQKQRRPREEWETEPMPNYEDESQEALQFRIGARVAHPTFGKGTIIKIEQGRGTMKLIVLFDSWGERRLVLPYAKLEIL
jgi:DNA helicase-2/ATP-dependent DNA helicase PcrA